jgi:hypothetical protein
MKISSKELEASKVRVIVDKNPVATSFEKWAQPGHFSRTLAKGPKTTTWIWNLHADAHDFDSQTSSLEIFLVRYLVLTLGNYLLSSFGLVKHISMVHVFQTILDFDEAFGKDPNFMFYDFNKPEDLPAELHG